MTENGENNASGRQPRASYKTKIRVKFPSFPQFIERYSKDISEGGMFIYTKNPKPPGTIIAFEILEKDTAVILDGEAEVRWIRQEDPARPDKEPGMGVQFKKLSVQSQSLIKRIVEENLKKSAKAPDEPERPPIKQKVQEAPNKGAGGLSDIEKMIEEAKKEDREQRDGIRTKGFFREEVPLEVKGAEAVSAVKSASVVGIDLGTTFSCVGYVKDGKPMIIPSSKGYRTIPSIVAYPEGSDVVVGHDAKPYLLTSPQKTVYGSKRMLGRKYRSNVIDEIKTYFKYKIVEGKDGEVAVELNGKQVPLQVISSLILKDLKGVAEDHFKKQITTAVITVPAYYNNRQRESVKEAGRLAGFEVKRIVNEPTAAALAYGLDKGLNEKVLIYDLGGGTFDVSILDISNNVFEVLASGGDSFLGGIDFDKRITNYLIEKFKEKTGIDVSKDDFAVQRIREAAEKAKIDLSTQSQTLVSIPFLAGPENGKKDMTVELTREKLNDLTRDLVNRTMQICQEVLRVKKLKRDDIDQIILVGGQTRMPLVSETLERIFGKQAKKGVHPDEVVALGAALLADTFDKVDSVVLLDSLSIPIGVGLPGGRFKPIVPKNTRIPFEKTFSLTTTKDDQTSLDIDIFQGESEQLSACEYLGTFVVDNIPKAKKGSSKIILTFNLDAECILNLKATETLSKRVIEAQMIVKETPDAVKKQFEKEKGGE